jgi:Zn-dependent protease with chaperone function
MTSYRYPNEILILIATLLLVGLVIVFTAAATVCTGLVFIILAVAMSYSSSKAHHHALLQAAYPVDSRRAPEVSALVETCVARLQPGPVQVFVSPSREINAYTFGLDSPKVVVLYSALFDLMDADELRFIIGHEMGHVALGHTWLNSLVGGLAGIPSSSTSMALLAMAFLSWNRACELSADRAGLIACGNPEKAITALVKLEAGPRGLTHAGLEAAYRRIDAEDDTAAGALGEIFASHPMLIRHINELRAWSQSSDYRVLRSGIPAVS